MTKIEEQKLLKRVAELEKQVVVLSQQNEVKKLDKYVYSASEVAKLLDVSIKTVYNMVEKGHLESIKLGHLMILGSSIRNKLGVVD